MAKKNDTAPVLSLAEVAELSLAKTTDAYADRVNSRRRAFVEQGKLIHHLDNMNLPKGQSIYGLLQKKGVPEGSVQQGRMTADMIAALVVPGLVTEARFDVIVTYRIIKHARALLKGKGAIKLPAENIAAIMATGDAPQITAELACLSEHGMTIVAREEQLAEKALEAERLAAAAAAAEKLRASAPAATPTPPAVTPTAPVATITTTPEDPTPDKPAEVPQVETSPTTVGTDGTETTEEETGTTVEEEEQDEEPAPVVHDGTRGNGPPPAPPTGPTLASVTGRMNDLLIEAMDLMPDELEKLVGFLRLAANDIAGTLKSLKVDAA